MKLSYELIVTDKEGKVIDRRDGESRSWLIAWLLLLYSCFQTVDQNITCTDGVARLNDQRYNTLASKAVAGDATRGSVVGSGTTAVALSDHALETQIAHGVGGGQLQYGATSFVYPPAILAKQCYFKMGRTFTNGSGGDVSVNEFGVYTDIGLGTFEACVCRDVLLNPVVVPDGAALTLRYRFRAEHTLP